MIIWPSNKDFAFAIIDDTDNSTIENIKPVYDYLLSKGINATKTVWVFKSRDEFSGQSLQDEKYLKFVNVLKNNGFEIQLHGVGSGCFNRDEILNGFEIFNEKIGYYPTIHINHANNPDCIYWGYKRFGIFIKLLQKFFNRNSHGYYGEVETSTHFWGDLCKEKIRFIRNRVFNGINTLKYDPQMPYIEKGKKFSNYWFSSSDGHTVEEFNNLITKRNVDKLKQQKGLCIVYTHFACGFVDEYGNLNNEFKERIDYLSIQNGWFAPASEILEFLASKKKSPYVYEFYKSITDLRWIVDRIIKRIRFNR